MPVMIEELEVQAQPQPAPAPSLANDPQAGGAVDERTLLAALATERWRQERLAAD